MAPRASAYKWKENSAAIREALKLPTDSSPWTQRPGIRLRGVPKLPRYIDCLDITYAQHCTRQDIPIDDFEAGSKGLWRDISQDISRNITGHNNIRSTRTTNTLNYCFARDRLECTTESLMALGYDSDISFGTLDARHMRDLAGEGQALPATAAMLYAIALEVDFAGMWTR